MPSHASVRLNENANVWFFCCNTKIHNIGAKFGEGCSENEEKDLKAKAKDHSKNQWNKYEFFTTICFQVNGTGGI